MAGPTGEGRLKYDAGVRQLGEAAAELLRSGEPWSTMLFMSSQKGHG